jgi:hypothetical protein
VLESPEPPPTPNGLVARLTIAISPVTVVSNWEGPPEMRCTSIEYEKRPVANVLARKPSSRKASQPD